MTTIESLDADAVTDDAFLGGALKLLQPKRGYRAGIDAVLLAAAVPATASRAERVLDVGAGVGTAGLCVASRIHDARVVLLEREPRLAGLARENIRRNAMADRVSAVHADVAAAASVLDQSGLEPGGFHHTLANPPFHAAHDGTASAHPLKASAHVMAAGDLAYWARFLARMTAPGGTMTLIHKAEALGDVLAALDGRFGALRVLPIHPRAPEPAIRILVRGVKGSRAPAVIRPGFVLHGAGSAFTAAAEAILKHGAPLLQGQDA